MYNPAQWQKRSVRLGAALFLVTAFLLAGAREEMLAHPENIQLAAVQMRLDLDDFWTPEAFEASIRRQFELVGEAADPDVPALVVFPEDVGLLLVLQGMEKQLAGITSIEEAINRAVRTKLLPVAWTRLIRWKSWVPALLLNRNRVIAETYFTVFSEAARDYGMYVVAGSVALPPYRISDGVVEWQRGPLEHNVYNTSYLFGPDGRVIGKQDKVELIELEREAALDLTAGSAANLQVFDTPLGRIGIAICLDAFDDAVVSRLVDQGADILVQPSANPGPWNEWQQEDWLRSSHKRVAADGFFTYAVNPMLTGPLWDIGFYGQSGIFGREAPASGHGYSLLGAERGFLSVAADDESEEILLETVPHPAAAGRVP